MKNHHPHPHPHPHHQNHRPLRLSVPSSSRTYPISPPSPFPFSPLPTPSKLRRHSFIYSSSSSSSSSFSYSSLFFILLSLRSLYSVFPFLRSSPPSFSLFPFSFLVSLLSFSLSSLFSPPPSSLIPLQTHFPILSLKSALFAVSLLLRFQSLRYNSTAATILTDLAGSLLASSFLLRKSPTPNKFLGLLSLILALFALSNSWDRIGCLPMSAASPPDEGCARVLPMLLPFISGFIGHYEREMGNWGDLKQLGRKKVRSLTLGFATLMLFFPALLSVVVMNEDGGFVSVWSLGWSLVNAVVFGVFLNENFIGGGGDEKVGFGREFAVTFACTLVLEMFYFPKLSLPGFLFCGLLLWVAVRELGGSSLDYFEIGSSNPPESLYTMVMRPIRQILSERKSRKIAMFLMINTGYMVVEFVAGFMSNSLGLISDACHMLFDCAALAIGLYASYISRLPADHWYNYGRGRTEVLSGYANAVLLVLVGVLIVLESIERILDPQEISTSSLLIVSIGGLLVNVVGLIFFHEEHHHAHGGGGTCSHSHSHSNSHHHEHHQPGHNSIDHDHGHNNEHHMCVGISHDTSNGHSQADLQHTCSNPNGHHHDSNKECVDDSSFGKTQDNHDQHCHVHGHENHRHDQEHDHHVHHQKVDVHIHQNSVEHKHDHQRLDVSLENSHDHCHEDHKHNHGHGDKENCNHKETVNSSDVQDHFHVHSNKTKKLPAHMDSRKHHHIDHNMEGIFLHVLADTMGSVGVVISTLLIKYKGWLVADPACSIFISVMIVASVIPLLRNSAEILLLRIPRAQEQDLKVAVDELMMIKGVCCIQKLHVWNLTNNDRVGTLHLHVSEATDKDSVKNRAAGLMHEAGIKDITIQVERIKGQ